MVLGVSVTDGVPNILKTSTGTGGRVLPPHSSWSVASWSKGKSLSSEGDSADPPSPSLGAESEVQSCTTSSFESSYWLDATFSLREERGKGRHYGSRSCMWTDGSSVWNSGGKTGGWPDPLLREWGSQTWKGREGRTASPQPRCIRCPPPDQCLLKPPLQPTWLPSLCGWLDNVGGICSGHPLRTASKLGKCSPYGGRSARTLGKKGTCHGGQRQTYGPVSPHTCG